MSFALNNFKDSMKSNATFACSTNSPLNPNLNTDDAVVKTEEKSISGCKSDNNTSLFVFGNQDQKISSDIKPAKAFNFIFNTNSLDPSPSNSNMESPQVVSLFDNKEQMEVKSGDSIKSDLSSNNINENSNEHSANNSSNNECLNKNNQRDDENTSNEKIVKIIVQEFKDVINSFIKERIEGENKITALETRITSLEEEVKALKTAASKESATINVDNNKDAAKSTAKSQILTSHQVPSPLILPPVEPFCAKKSAFGSTSSLFGANSTPIFSSTSTNNIFGSVASTLLGNDDNTIGTSTFNPTPPAQVQGISPIFSTSIQSNGKSLAPDRKKAQKLFSHEAVTDFLSAQKESDTKKINPGNHFKKIQNGHDTSEQNQNVTAKEAYELHLQKTIEMIVKKAMESYWEHFKSNTSEDNFNKFNSGIF